MPSSSHQGKQWPPPRQAAGDHCPQWLRVRFGGVQAFTPAATVALMVSVTSACRNVVVRGAYSQFFFIVPPIGPSEAAKVPHESWGAYRGRTFAPNFRVPNPAHLRHLLVGSATAKSLRRSA